MNSKSQVEDYKAGLDQRFWAYQRSHFPEFGKFFDGAYTEDKGRPVFSVKGAGRNVIVNPNATKQELAGLMGLVREGDRHKWFRSMSSSQALAQSVLGNLTIYGHLGRLAEMLDDDGLPLLGRAAIQDHNFRMEFKLDYLGEPRPTSLDAYIDGDYRTAIECKFTEPEFGPCSRPGLSPTDPSYEREHCNGTYTKQSGRNELCPLTQIGVRYWQYVPEFFHWDADQDLTPCPLNANYQLVRNVLAIGVRRDGSVSSSDGHALVIYDERNPAFQAKGKGAEAFTETRQALRQPAMLRKCSWQRITHYLRANGVLPWLTEELFEKYGL